MKQTAVEWLVETLNKKYRNDDFIVTFWYLIEQAKEMEKQQILKALKMGVNIEIGINEFKDLNLTYNQAFDKYYKDNYENKRI